MKDLKRYIKEHLAEDLTLDCLAQVSGYSKFHLLRKFRDENGITVHKYIQNCRLAYAAEQLATSQKAIVEIAFEAKYQSQPAFTLAFKQVYQCTPMVWRQRSSVSCTMRRMAA